jgi:hypothetical protein
MERGNGSVMDEAPLGEEAPIELRWASSRKMAMPAMRHDGAQFQSSGATVTVSPSRSFDQMSWQDRRDPA